MAKILLYVELASLMRIGEFWLVIEQLSNKSKESIRINNAIIYTEEQGQRKYILVRLCTLLNAISSITMEWKKSLVLLILIK